MLRRSWLALALLTAACTRTPDVTTTPMTDARPALEDPPEARRLRAHLVDSVARRWRVKDARVLDAMRAVPRHWFVDAPLADAYLDRPLSIGSGQTISQPTIVAIMSESLSLDGSERVLEIGTGSGYQAAILSRLAKTVYTIELIPALGEQARHRLADAGFSNVHVRIGDGYRGWPEEAPFDRVIVTAAPTKIPDELFRDLRIGGILVVPVGEGREQRLERWVKSETGLVREDLGPVIFVPMVHGDERPPSRR